MLEMQSHIFDKVMLNFLNMKNKITEMGKKKTAYSSELKSINDPQGNRSVYELEL
ncbi:hypothetical protein [Cedecea davisae]|uniref:Uncharacterized protein n=1 Tax=Cedecea davisae DSM 4568 TaxID=566551 RepID=S3IZD2_9ENTR|nr:hypothetical protein [Cedecea davisae]EPF17861.1 hypothetical protein HMPREF0201_01845 [Cedecea davisae DSM 4568]